MKIKMRDLESRRMNWDKCGENVVKMTRQERANKMPEKAVPKVTIGRIDFHNVTMEETVQTILSMVSSKKVAQYVCTGNLDHLLMLQKDDKFRNIYGNADLVVADGMPIVWLSRLLRNTKPLKERVAGSDLFWELARTSHETGLRLFFLGGVPGSAVRAAEVVRKKYPNANICGIYCPPFENFGKPEEEARIREQIQAARPDILFVGFGAPKQEKWIADHREELHVPVSIGIGGTFEMAGGIVKRAPLWAQKSGIEWIYRLTQDPKRLWKRYIVGDLPFFFRLLLMSLWDNQKPSAKMIGPLPETAWQEDTPVSDSINNSPMGYERQNPTTVQSLKGYTTRQVEAGNP